MSAEELPPDILISRELAQEYTQLNEFAAEQDAQITAEIGAMKAPSEEVIRQLAEQAWKECWVDTHSKELLWQAQDTKDELGLTEVLTAYRQADDTAEGYDILSRLDGLSLAKLEAILRFGCYPEKGKAYVDPDFLDSARQLVSAYDFENREDNNGADDLSGRQLKLACLSRIVCYSRDPADYQAWMDAALISASGRRQSITDLIPIAAQGYLPAFIMAKDLVVQQAALLRGATGNFVLDASVVFSGAMEDVDRQAAKLAVIDRQIKLASTPIIEPPDGSVAENPGLDQAFLNLIRSKGVIEQLKQGVSLPDTYSPLEEDILSTWKDMGTSSVLKTEDELWDYARRRIIELRKSLAQSGQPSFNHLKDLIQGADYSGFADIPKREIPKTRLDIWALEADEIEHRRTGKRKPNPGMVELRPEERRQIRRQYEEEDADALEDVTLGMVSINYSLLYRALYCYIASVDKVDDRI